MLKKIHYKLSFFVAIAIVGFMCLCYSWASSPFTNNFHPYNDSISKAALLGKIEPATDSGFILVPFVYSVNKRCYLRKEAYQAFVKMHEAAKKDGISLKILSATRTFSDQKKLWEAKWTGSAKYFGINIPATYPNHLDRASYILNYIAMPGTSRHHWGTDIDINSVETWYFDTEAGKKQYSWLKKNASSYGFCQPYTTKDSLRPSGFEEEKWHWSYQPLSSQYLEQYKQSITLDDLVGFSGHETSRELDIINQYALSVNLTCQ